MKKVILFAIAATMTMTSCFKKRTCTCKNADGKVNSQTTTKSNNVKDFEEKCKNSSTKETWGSAPNATVVTTPCELS